MKPGHETAITGGAAREAVQRMRHAADAVLTGIGTVLADDPLLTDRTGWRDGEGCCAWWWIRGCGSAEISDRAIGRGRRCGVYRRKRASSAKSARDRAGRSRSGERAVAERARGTARSASRAGASAQILNLHDRSRSGAEWRGCRRGTRGQNGAFLRAEDHGNGRACRWRRFRRAGFRRRPRFRA